MGSVSVKLVGQLDSRTNWTVYRCNILKQLIIKKYSPIALGNCKIRKFIFHDKFIVQLSGCPTNFSKVFTCEAGGLINLSQKTHFHFIEVKSTLYFVFWLVQIINVFLGLFSLVECVDYFFYKNEHGVAFFIGPLLQLLSYVCLHIIALLTIAYDKCIHNNFDTLNQK